MDKDFNEKDIVYNPIVKGEHNLAILCPVCGEVLNNCMGASNCPNCGQKLDFTEIIGL